MSRILAAVTLVIGVTAATADDKAVKKELEKFNGEWQAVSVIRDGEPIPKKEAKGIRLTVDGEKYTLQLGDETIEGTHKLDPTTDPKQIDAVRTKGPDAGKTLHGVYELTNKRFVVCFAAPGADRPEKLDPEGGPGLRVLTFRRAEEKDKE